MARRGVAEIGAGVGEPGTGCDVSARNAAHPVDARIVEEQVEEAAAEVARRPRQPDVDCTTSKASSAAAMSASLWVAMTEARSSARPLCTAGGMAQLRYTP